MSNKVPIALLGQSGCCMQFGEVRIYIDPYLSNSVQELDSWDLKRLIPIAVAPESVTNADWVLITHEHIDHCDPQTLPVLASASPNAQFLGPSNVVTILEGWGIDPSRLHCCSETEWLELTWGLKVIATVAAHPEIVLDEKGRSAFVGYVFDFEGKRIYHAGDTAVADEVIADVASKGPFIAAFLPVNERNFWRERRGIIGNMSVREAFGFADEINAKQVVPVHWDMFAANETLPQEIRAVYARVKPSCDLVMQPDYINLTDVRVSVIIRTLDEARYLEEVLRAISSQEVDGLRHEVIIVDSGSTDGTLNIAEHHGCRILHITREEFSFGRSLNMGCESANGDLLVFVSGHCVPVDRYWLQRLVQPLIDGQAGYSFGRQLGGATSQFSEKRIFAKYFPRHPYNGQKEYFCNNANAALAYTEWTRLRFDEELTGLEDMELAQRLVRDGGRVVYVPDAAVYHYHHESWAQVRGRFEREALALQRIMPNVHVGPVDVVRYVFTSVARDWAKAWREGVWLNEAVDIVRYRWSQYSGTYKGNNEHRRLSHSEKEKYFYPE